MEYFILCKKKNCSFFIGMNSASTERSFSKLKLIKNYLRSTVLQKRFSDLALLTIEKYVSTNLDYEIIIENFAATIV